ncbi:MAG: magnesium/cobalt transporter CorA [Caldilineaceae bacterium]
MIRTLYRHRSGTQLMDLPGDQLLAAVQDKQARLWIDMQKPTEAEAKLVLEEAFHFHPLSIEDTLNDVHTPKMDDYGRYRYLVLHAIGMGDERMDIHTKELDVFVGANFLITVHEQPMSVIDAFWNEEHHQSKGLARGPVYLLYELMDRQIDAYIPLIDRFEERLEELGDLIFLNGQTNDKTLLNDILTAKSSALRMRRILRPQSAIMEKLAWNEFSVIPHEARIYFQDVYDHLFRLSELADSMRDLAGSTIETHLTLVNNRMNEIMKVLTMISTIFIPLGFIASVYGMNFHYMPELERVWTYPLVWILFLLIAGGMIWMFRRRGWI